MPGCPEPSPESSLLVASSGLSPPWPPPWCPVHAPGSGVTRLTESPGRVYISIRLDRIETRSPRATGPPPRPSPTQQTNRRVTNCSQMQIPRR